MILEAWDIYIFFIIVGAIQKLIWDKETGTTRFLDYHGLMSLMFLSYMIGRSDLTTELSLIDVLSHSAIANVLFEMMNKGTWNIKTDDVTFNIYGKLIWYRWWVFYVVPPVIGFLLLLANY